MGGRNENNADVKINRGPPPFVCSVPVSTITKHQEKEDENEEKKSDFI